MLNANKQPTPEHNPGTVPSASTMGSFERLFDSADAASLLGIRKQILERMARNAPAAGVRTGDLWRFRHKVWTSGLPRKLRANTKNSTTFLLDYER